MRECVWQVENIIFFLYNPIDPVLGFFSFTRNVINIMTCIPKKANDYDPICKMLEPFVFE